MNDQKAHLEFRLQLLKLEFNSGYLSDPLQEMRRVSRIQKEMTEIRLLLRNL